MAGDVSHNENQGKVDGIHFQNRLGKGIEIASLPELGPGGSWSTCMMGCNSEPPRDVGMYVLLSHQLNESICFNELISHH